MSKLYLTAIVVIFLTLALVQILLRVSLIREVETVEPSYIAYVTAQACREENIIDHVTASECANIAIFDTKSRKTLIIDVTSQIWLASLSWSYDQRYLSYSDGSDIHVYDTKRRNLMNITNNKTETLEIYSKWSPKDYVIAFTSYGNTASLPSLWVYELSQESPLKITDGFTGTFTWSPNGDEIVLGKFLNRLKSFEWYLSKIDDGSVELLFRTNSEVHNLVWSDDGSCIIFTEQDGSSSNVFSICSGRNTVTKLTHGPLSHTVNPNWAYGGNVMPYSDTFTNIFLAHLIDLRTNIVFDFPLIQGVINFDFSPDKVGFAYMTSDNKLCISYFLKNRSDCTQVIAAYPGTMLAWSR
jgi:Tol biopolymer transport system component